MPHPPIHKTNQAKLQAACEKSQRHYVKNRDCILKKRRELHVEKTKPLWEIQQFEKAVARALKSCDDEDESDTELSETDESSDDENDTLSDLPGCLLALKGIKDKMLSLTDDHEPQKFVEDKFLQYVKSIKYTDDHGDNSDVTIISNMMLKQYIYPPHSNNHDMQEKFYVLNQELEQSRQLASAMTEREEASQLSTSKNKHTSFTQTQDMSCSRLSARVKYFEGSASASMEHQVLPVCDPQSFNDLDFNIMDGVHENYLEDTNIEPTRKRKCTAGDCFGTELYCQSCTVERHHEHPLHRIKHWKDAFFHDVILKSLRLQIQLGHPTQERCYNSAACQDFIVLHVNGIHKVSAFEYWQTLMCFTHNRGVVIVKDCYDTLLQMNTGMVLEQQSKAHVPSCVLLVLSLNVSLDQMDPGLNCGWAYFMEEQKYKTFLTDVRRCPQEKSTCASHNTVNLAETKNSWGLAATGAGTVDCLQHNFKWPCDVGDLQKGEKYMNMNYLFFLTMQHMGDIMVLNISYDIACQWNYLLSQPPQRQEWTDGEAHECGWANINPVATSTCKMGPGSCHDTLDDHFGDFNWKKVTNMGVSLSRKLKAVVPECDQHVCDFKDFKNALEHKRPEQVVEWSLSQQEADNLEHGMDDLLHEEVSCSMLISSGMEIKDQQCQLARDIELLGGHPTNLQCTKLQEWGNIL
ncbi:hypothetical protein BDR04DRAFT_1123134 [Suillus decipiens]|nr:hypothetical protein BDR04DRAFT_1123134 [Suillus decipiens]